MAQLDKLTYEGKYNDPSTGLLKDNTNHEIVPSRHRAQVTDTKDSFVNWVDEVADEDDMISDSAVKVPTQQSVKAYVDAQVGAGGTTIPYGATSGTNSYTIAATPAITAYANTDLYQVEIGTTSTGPVTFDFDSVGVKKVYATPEHQMGDGELTAGRRYLFTYDPDLDGALGGFLLLNESVQGRVYISPNAYDASGGAVPSAIGSGPSGAVKHGDAFRVSTGGTVGGVILETGDLLISRSDAPAAITDYVVLAGMASTDAKFALKANLLSPTFTGTPAAPTASPGTNTTQIATTAFVATALGTVDASTTAQGVVELATLAEVVAGTDTGSEAQLVVQPSQLGGERTTDGSSATASVQTDHLGLVKFNSASPFNFTLDPLIIKTKITFINIGAGAVTFIPGSGVTIIGATVLAGAVSTDYPGCFVVYDGLNSPRVVMGSASVIGIQEKWVPATDMWPMTTGGCAALAKTEIATSSLNIQTLDFDQTTEEYAQFTIVLPKKYTLSFTYKVYWTAAAGTPSETVRWSVNTIGYSNDDPLTGTFGSATAIDDTLIATNDLHITPESASLSVTSGATGDFIGFMIRRVTASDSLAADAKLLGVMLRLVTNAAIDN